MTESLNLRPIASTQHRALVQDRRKRLGFGRLSLSTLAATGMPVGLMETAEFGVAEEHLAPGDKVIIYTDGVT